MHRAWLVGIAACLVSAPTAFGEHCEPQTKPEFDGFGFYVENDICQPECQASLWVYQESNGIPGLQRDDATSPACWHVPADTLVAAAFLHEDLP